MICRRVHLLAVVLIAMMCATVAHGESLFLGQPQTPFNVQATKVDVRYTVTDSVNHIGQFTAMGKATSFGGVSNNITGGSYSVSVFFDLLTGMVRASDPGNFISVTGTINSVFKTFYASTTLNKFGSGTEDTFDVRFASNTGSVLPGTMITSRIVGTAIPNFHDPSFVYGGAGANGYIIWQNTAVGGSKIGSANVWAPVPSSAYGGGFLLLALAGHGAYRRRVSQRRQHAA